jgi:hypothetical protein
VHVLRFAEPVVVHQTGSGDAAFDYVQLFVYASSATLVAVIWSWRVRGRALSPRAWQAAKLRDMRVANRELKVFVMMGLIRVSGQV